MTLVDIVLVLIVVGLILWLVNTYVPMAGGIKSLLNVVVFVVVRSGSYRCLGSWAPFRYVFPPLR